ncbi:MAG: GNAT family N-acetyltransferase [Jannaschia helgolandensis]|nr:GNAT family N-acetyltransferase [Jannaschia helgolandensis]
MNTLYARLPMTLSGPVVSLRSITPGDAAFVHGLRSDPVLARHLHPVTGGIEGQVRWLKKAEIRGYYVIAGPTGDCGLLRLSNLCDAGFTWGSWLLHPAMKPRRAALESALMVYRIGFDLLGLPKATFDVRRANTAALAFHDRFGATRIGATETDILYRLTASDWNRAAPGLLAAQERIAV